MKVDFRPLTYEAIEVLSMSTGVDYSQTEFSDENTWFCVTVRNGTDIALIVVFEFKSWHDAHVSTVCLDPRALTRRLLTAMTRAIFSRAARITALVDPTNEIALKQVWRMGFKYEGYLRRGIEGNRDAVVFGLLPEDCPYLSGEPFRFQRVTHDLQPGVH
jgi:RimJ/RimL family protein N-acetyltransferase